MERAELVQAKKRKKLEKFKIDEMILIPPTSNKVERLFSRIGNIFTTHRKSMDPYNLENVIFLRENSSQKGCENC